jgi:hypothetical protein
MAEGGGITELQILQADVAALKKQLGKIREADNTSAHCSAIVSAIHAAEAKDAFLMKEGGLAEQNAFHTQTRASDGGCCVVL